MKRTALRSNFFSKGRRLTSRRRQNISDLPYLKWLRTQPCLICGQSRYVEAAHVGARGLGQTCPDRQAVPLCSKHHRTGPYAHHVLGKRFWVFHRMDRGAVIEGLIRRYEAES